MYYVGKNRQQSGPFTLEELRAMVGKDQLHVDDLIWKEGMPEWQQAGTLPGLFGSAAVPPPPLGISPPGAQASHGYPPPTFQEVPTYMWQAVVLTVLCCPLFGIPAIVYASQVNSKMVVGDVEGARLASKNARAWCWVSVIGSVIAYGISLWFTYQNFSALEL